MAPGAADLRTRDGATSSRPIAISSDTPTAKNLLSDCDVAQYLGGGLDRRREAAELLKPGEDYRLEDAGRAEGRPPLLAVYRSSEIVTEEPQ